MEEENQEPSELVKNINSSMMKGEEKHNKFVAEYKSKNNDSIDGFYKVYCLENDYAENERVEKYWNSINPNVNRLYEFKHLTALRNRDISEIYSILRDEATTDIFIETNLLDKEQFLELIKLGKAIWGGVIGGYLKSITFISSDNEWLINEMKMFIGRDTAARNDFNAICKSVDVKFVKHFDKSTEIKLDGI